MSDLKVRPPSAGSPAGGIGAAKSGKVNSSAKAGKKARLHVGPKGPTPSHGGSGERRRRQPRRRHRLSQKLFLFFPRSVLRHAHFDHFADQRAWQRMVWLKTDGAFAGLVILEFVFVGSYRGRSGVEGAVI